MNLLDWSSWQQNWQNPVSLSGDLNGDGIGDPDDFLLLFSDWLWRNPLQPNHFLFGHAGISGDDALRLYADNLGNLKIDLGSLDAIDFGV